MAANPFGEWLWTTLPLARARPLTRSSAWDEIRVGEWLRSIGCVQYEQMFLGKCLEPCRPELDC
jgi:hypothetical protein